ncbi:MAG: hypothetical protein A2283_15440 [Lentisphaerae bacterium RIFOXYA12_FULL_48_11]|nr:MAG: hypothetical protein A2283_15440 [Lentisphaerae bacterium RIFOXYA12_FULL_48_11]
MVYVLAVLSCCFSLIVGMLMLANVFTVRMSLPLDMPEIEQLRTALKDNPSDEMLKNKIRDMDLASRRFYFASLTSLGTGSLLLLGGLVFAVISLKTLSVMRMKMPNPKEYVMRPEDLAAAASARWVIGGLSVVLLTASIVTGILWQRNESDVIEISDVHKVMVEGQGTKEKVVVSIQPLGPPPLRADFLTNWPAFRGPTGCGTSSYTNTPISWDGKSGKGIIWKVKVPLPGLSSPVIWGKRVFLTGANEKKREVYCFDSANGTLLWTMAVDSAPGNTNKVPQVNQDTGYAAPTSVTDGRIVYSIFANGDISAFDFCAQKMWLADLGLPGNKYGFSASPVLHNGKILIQFDYGGEDGRTSQLIALDAGSGKKVWSASRPVTESWPSPILIDTGKGFQLVTMANEFVVSHDPDSGKELWRVKCGGSDVAPSPIFAGGLVIATETSDLIYAIKPDGAGDVTKTHVAWKSEDGVSDVASPVSNGDLVFFAHSGGTITCLDVKTGKIVWDKSFDGEFYASPGLAGNLIYQVSRSGEVFIFKADRQYAAIGKASLGEPSDCSPAFVDGKIFMRGATNLFCIGTN